MDSSRRSSSRQDTIAGSSRDSSNCPRSFNIARQLSTGYDLAYSTQHYESGHSTHDAAGQGGSSSGYDRAYSARDATQHSSSNLESGPNWIIGMGGEPPVTEFYTPEVPSQEPTDNGRYLDDWNIQPNQSAGDRLRRTEPRSAAGQYAQDTMGEDQYLLYRSYSYKIKSKRHEEITPEERVANARYHRLLKEYQKAEDMISAGDHDRRTEPRSAAGQYVRETMKKDQYQLFRSYFNKTSTNRHTEITPEERAANAEYKRLLASYRKGEDMINEYTTK